MAPTLIIVMLFCVLSFRITAAFDNDEFRQSLVKSYFECGYSYNLILCFLVAVYGIVISLRTLKRLLRRMNLKRRGASSANLRRAARYMMEELSQTGSLLGYRAMHLRLRQQYGLRISREDVRRMLGLLHPVGVRARRRHRLNRRQYISKGPNYCWHLDGNDKLLRYGFAIHGCIDGFSRKVLWLEVCPSNKDSFVIAGFYMEPITKYGCPTLVRADRGTENAKIAFMQPFLRRMGSDSHSGQNSFRYGKSVHNQRIERWWGSLHQWCTLFWIDFFKSLKEEGHFYDSDPIQRDCLRFAFMDIIQADLNRTKDAWNSHRIRSGVNGDNGIPDELFFFARN